MNNLIGKRFILGIIALICVSVTAVLEHYAPEVYVSLITAIIGMFVVSQSMTDLNGK